MAWWLATPADGTARSAIARFDPRYWTINFPRPMMASVTTPQTANDAMTVDTVFYTKGDLCGLIWASEDTYDHPLLRYQTLRDYRGATLSFRWQSTGIIALDQLNGPTLTIEGRDSNGAPRAWYVRLWNYASGSPTDATINIDFSNLSGGFNLPVDKDPVFSGYIDRMFISLVPVGYVQGSTDPLPAGQEGRVQVTNVVVGGTNKTLALGNSKVRQHSIQIATGYDDQYNLTPARVMRNIQWLGYRGAIVHYVGMSHYFGLEPNSGGAITSALMVERCARPARLGTTTMPPGARVSATISSSRCPTRFWISTSGAIGSKSTIPEAERSPDGSRRPRSCRRAIPAPCPTFRLSRARSRRSLPRPGCR